VSRKETLQDQAWYTQPTTPTLPLQQVLETSILFLGAS